MKFTAVEEIRLGENERKRQKKARDSNVQDCMRHRKI